MSKNPTNLLGIVIAIIAGTYFNLMLCNTCTVKTEDVAKYRKRVERKNDHLNIDQNNRP